MHLVTLHGASAGRIMSHKARYISESCSAEVGYHARLYWKIVISLNQHFVVRKCSFLLSGYSNILFSLTGCERLSGKSEGEDSLNNGVFKIGGHSCSGCVITQENEEIKATITWYDKSDTIILKNH
ncbi:hypothetical protein AM500_12175 [Bacillus sp. FJAT-18017]|nr:hypothetical protein AM500_12175 [Bacillus sp. FJAT-18017]